MADRRSSRAEDVRLFVGTFNLGNSPPDLAFAEHFAAHAIGYDVVVIGHCHVFPHSSLQEAHYSTSHGRLDPALVAQHVHRRDAVAGDSSKASHTSWASRMVTGAGLVGGALAGGALLATAWPLALTGAAVGAAVGAAAGSKVSDELECRTHVAEVIHAALGRDKYEVSASLALLQLRCLVFCRVGAFGGDAMPAAVSTWHHDAGMVPGVATKGALGISLRLPNTKAPIAFVACHLAAHAGHSNMQLRNAQVAQALQAGGGGAGAASLFESHAHVFVLGDLNYRLDADALLAARGATDAAERRAEGSSPVEGGEAWQCVVGAISASKWVDLSAVDELTVQRSEARHPLNEFSEGPLLFAPTYKVQRGGPAAAAAAAARTDRPGQSAAGSAQAVPRYNTKRVPSWTDRVLWWSTPQRKRSIVLTSYRPAVAVATSDHIPLTATFMLRLANL